MPASPPAASAQALQAAEADRSAPEADRLENVGAAAERAVDHDPGAAGDGNGISGRMSSRPRPVVELGVRRGSRRRSTRRRDRAAITGILGGAMPLITSGILYLSLMRFTLRSPAPSGIRGRWTSRRLARDVTLGEVAFAPAVMRRFVDGEAEGGIRVADGALDVPSTKSVVAAGS